MNQEYLNKMRNIHDNLIELIGNQYSDINDVNIFINFLVDQKISENIYELKTFLHMIMKITNYHYRTPDFFIKIEKILNSLKKEIIQAFTNDQLFNIFKGNKRILLYLFNEKMIEPTRSMALTITDAKHRKYNYPEYFYPEFKKLFTQLIELDRIKYKQIEEAIKNIEKKYEIDDEKRKIGENDDFICQIIRNDSVNEFIAYINQNNCLVTADINQSIYETHNFLVGKKLTLIEYCAFFGAFEIMKYLYHQTILLSPNLWILAAHGNNPQLIHLLEENKIKPNDDVYHQCFLEAIKCHHNDIANYIENNFLLNFDNSIILIQGINYLNFSYFDDDAVIDFDVFYYLCRNDYFVLVDSFLKSASIDINMRKISKYFIFLYNFKHQKFFYKISKDIFFE